MTAGFGSSLEDLQWGQLFDSLSFDSQSFDSQIDNLGQQFEQTKYPHLLQTLKLTSGFSTTHMGHTK